MGQNDRVRLSMWQIESSPKRMAELVVESHADRAKTMTAEPSAILRFGTSSYILRTVDDDR